MQTVIALLESRKFWIAFLGTLSVVAVQLGMSPEKANAITNAILALGATLIGGIAVEDAAEKHGAGQVIIPDPSKANGSNATAISQAKASLGILLILLLPAFALIFTGCGAPSQLQATTDQGRLDYEHDINAEYIANHPDQKQTVQNFERTWQRDIAATAGKSPATSPVSTNSGAGN